MKLKMYSVPNGIFGTENKPSKQTFAQIVTNAETLSYECETTSNLSLETSFVQGSMPAGTEQFDYMSVNMISGTNPNSNQTYYYEVIGAEIEQLGTETAYGVIVYQITFDYYLTFACNLFDEVNTNSQGMVYWKRKHVNRYLWNTQLGVYQLDFQKQFWLLSLDKDLHNLGGNTEKISYVKSPTELGTGNYGIFTKPNTSHQVSLSTLNGNNMTYNNASSFVHINSNLPEFSGLLYLYALLTPSPELINNLPKNELPNSNGFLYLITLYGIISKTLLVPILPAYGNQYYGINSGEGGTPTSNFMSQIPNIVGNGEGQTYHYGIGIFNFCQENFGKDQIKDVLVLPFAPQELLSGQATYNFALGNGIIQSSGITMGLFQKFEAGTYPEYPAYRILGFLPLNSTIVSPAGYGQQQMINNVVDLNGEKMFIMQTFCKGIVVEPMLFHSALYHFRLRIGTQDQLIYLSQFKNINATQNGNTYAKLLQCGFGIGLLSFNLSFDYPNTNFTNLDIQTFNNIFQVSNTGTGDAQIQQDVSAFNPQYLAEVYNINMASDLLFNFEWRMTTASQSNNWVSYQQQNHNQYLLGRNMAISSMFGGAVNMALSALPNFGAGEVSTLSGVVGNSINKSALSTSSDVHHLNSGSGGGTADGNFGPSGAAARMIGRSSTLSETQGNRAARSLTQSGSSYHNKSSSQLSALGGLAGLANNIMSYEYKYDGGMQQDMSREGQIKGAGALNPLIAGQTTITLIEESIVPMAKEIVKQRYSLKGYVLNRFGAFGTGNNRYMFNGVQIENFCAVMLPKVNSKVKMIVDNILNSGIRIGNVANFQDNLQYLPGDTGKNNNEINPQNNTEINNLNGI